MKSILKNTIFAFALISIFGGCKKTDSLDHLNVTAVQNLYSPADNKSILLSPNGSRLFEWEAAKAEDGGLVMYEVAFDKLGGDFSHPVYKLSSDNNGMSNSANITDKVLNKIGALSGLGSSETGKLIWTIVASKGVNEVKSSLVMTLEIKRLAGFADVPTDVFVTGEGAEGGVDLSKAMAMKAVAPGEFEVYTKLVAGKAYSFVDRNAGTPRTFYVSGGTLKETGTATVENTGVYRIKLDFNTLATEYTQMKKLELFFSPLNVFWFELPYVGNGVFKASSQTIIFKQEGWGRDERYKFRMTVNTGAGADDTYEWLGSKNSDNSRPDNAPLSFYYLLPVDADQWHNAFKFRTEIDNTLSDVSAFFQADKTYTHEVVKVSSISTK